MKVTVTPEVVGGTRRGGEDLFLVFEAKGEPSDTFDVVLENGNSSSWQCETDETDPAAVFFCVTDAYGFKWEGTLLDLTELVRKEGVTNLEFWEWAGKATDTPQKRFRCLHFVNGNAD